MRNIARDYPKVKEIEALIKDYSETAHLDALEFVASSVRGRFKITQADIDEFVERIKKHEPVTRIVGSRGFWRSEFKVTPDVLDPRPDTECLVGAVLEHFKELWPERRILDIGTGSGCVLISLLWEYPNSKGVAIDISPEALKIAKLNAYRIQRQEWERTKNIELIEFIERNFYDEDFTKDLGRFDIIVSNPPYIPTAEIDTLHPSVRLYDPLIALDGGKDGLDAYRALAKHLKHLLTDDGLIFLEIGKGQAKAVTRLMYDAGYKIRAKYRDYGKIVRVLVFSPYKK